MKTPWRYAAVTMVAAVLVTFLFCFTSAWGQWRANQRSHQLSVLPDSSTLRLCRDFTNQTRFRQILKPLMVTRVVDTPQHRAVGNYINEFLTNLGFKTEWDAFQDTTPFGPRNFRNLIATYDEKAPRRLVLACHYDSIILPGQAMVAATDSAVPCAMMMDIAQTIVPYMYKRVAQDVGLQLIFFDGEEAFKQWTATDSLYGSRHLAKKWESKWYPTTAGSNFELSKEIDRIDVMMLLDLLGAKNPRISNAVGLGANQLFSQLADVETNLRGLGCANKVNKVFYSGLSFNTVEDDHIPFLRRGTPILHLITVPFPDVWHTPADNEKALHWPTIDHLTSVVRVFVAKYLGIAPA
ncbi:unnamed protein product [Caenorhabditis auriculariae]|uniref:Glutaminyl-peptide cyclotransferase n=1 Tax=Caenorhabditis auriculariae TaxID=2777116 RepID=A0A8S1HUW2_9PELO|nr:unnamed protein product [Caenorhabditis auriculariae]